MDNKIYVFFLSAFLFTQPYSISNGGDVMPNENIIEIGSDEEQIETTFKERIEETEKLSDSLSLEIKNIDAITHELYELRDEIRKEVEKNKNVDLK